MGATDFTEYVESKYLSRNTIENAYSYAVEQARCEYGSDGYNGTISTTSGCQLVGPRSAITRDAAYLYAQQNLHRAHKWEAALGLPVADDDQFTFRTVQLRVTVNPGDKVSGWENVSGVIRDYDVRAAAEKAAYDKYGTQVHKVEVTTAIKENIVVNTTPGKAVLRWAVSRGNSGYNLFETKAKAVAYAKEYLKKDKYADKVEIRQIRAFPDANTTVTATVERTTGSAIGVATVTLATPKDRPDPPSTGWLFFGLAAC